MVGGQPPTTRNRARLSPICPREIAASLLDFRPSLAARFAIEGCAVAVTILDGATIHATTTTRVTEPRQPWRFRSARSRALGSSRRVHGARQSASRPEREHVHYHGHDYTLRGSETRTLTTVGAFRAVPAHDLRDRFDQPLDPRHGELWHLRDSGLVQTVRLDRDHTVVTLTKEGRGLLESRRLDEDSRDRQAFHNGVQKPRELKHDAELYRAYMEEAERLRDEGANIHRIVLENDLKSEYQEFLQERNRDRDDSDGRPDRDPLRSRNGRGSTTFRATTRATSSSRTCALNTTSMDATMRSTSR